MNESERRSIKAALEELAGRIIKAYETNDAELYLSAFDAEAIVSMPGVPPVRGHEALKRSFENRPALPPGATFEVEALELEALSPVWAYAFGTDTLTLAEGKKATMTFLVLIRNTPDGWKTYREVLSADQP